MRAFYVVFDTAGTSGYSEVLLVKDEQVLENALEAKTTKCFKVGNFYSKITHKQEIPLSQVKIADLSITEFLLLKNL
jgi:hypothetical protein